MSKKPDGGAAFPYAFRPSDARASWYRHAAIRDWFAGMAMHLTGDDVERAYRIADAMIAEREK